jgi:hypothetical protein
LTSFVFVIEYETVGESESKLVLGGQYVFGEVPLLVQLHCVE